MTANKKKLKAGLGEWHYLPVKGTRGEWVFRYVPKRFCIVSYQPQFQSKNERSSYSLFDAVRMEWVMSEELAGDIRQVAERLVTGDTFSGVTA